MPAAPVAAGISAVGQIGGAAIAGKGAKKAAKIQAQTAQTQIAEARNYYNDGVARYAPDIAAGDSASKLYNGAIGNGGDPAAADAAYKQFQGSTGYQTTLNNSLDAVNASAYASGLGRSGAALKALSDRGAYNAQQTYQSWLSDLSNPIQNGIVAKGAVGGIALNTLASNNQSSSNAANAASNAALTTGSAWSSALQNISNVAADAYKSSYGGGK